MRDKTALTIIIPAHNEGAVIGACLQSLAGQENAPPARVIVVANGCSDATAATAEAHRLALAVRGMDLEVAEIDEASKPAALNAGDRAAPADCHRMYLDADVELSTNALEVIFAALERPGGPMFCSPQIETVSRTYAARVYSRIWPELPYVRDEVIGAGLYAMTAAGRRRWSTFPDIVADDKFARLHFAETERAVLPDAWFRVHLPVGARELVRVRSRWIRANHELRREFPHLAAGDRRRWAGVPAFVGRRVDLWKDMPAFVAIYACAEARAWLQRFARRPVPWESATTSRQGRADDAELPQLLGGPGIAGKAAGPAEPVS